MTSKNKKVYWQRFVLMKNHYFLTQTRKSNSYLLVTVLGYYRLKHINSRRNLESMQKLSEDILRNLEPNCDTDVLARVAKIKFK